MKIGSVYLMARWLQDNSSPGIINFLVHTFIDELLHELPPRIKMHELNNAIINLRVTTNAPFVDSSIKKEHTSASRERERDKFSENISYVGWASVGPFPQH